MHIAGRNNLLFFSDTIFTGQRAAGGKEGRADKVLSPAIEHYSVFNGTKGLFFSTSSSFQVVFAISLQSEK
ncbi:MAG: hypothetical protein BWY93_01131 [Euryarchaeota archaeon ADurb.BinA087]|nr:MAG: hypothetical protein BWY93_01131 [Euryarchaeota archaeon ADurb.BinA087]